MEKNEPPAKWRFDIRWFLASFFLAIFIAIVIFGWQVLCSPKFKPLRWLVAVYALLVAVYALYLIICCFYSKRRNGWKKFRELMVHS